MRAVSNHLPDRESFFTCLLPPDSIRMQFNEVAAAAPTGAVLQRAEDLHITLNYLQRPRKRARSELIDRLARIEFPAFDVKLTEVDAFFRIPRKTMDTHVLWMRPDAYAGWNIRELHAKILLSLRPVGFNVGANEMTPHMTILKYPFHSAAEPLRDFIADNRDLPMPSWRADKFYLCRTRRYDDPLHPVNNNNAGSKYETVAEFALR